MGFPDKLYEIVCAEQQELELESSLIRRDLKAITSYELRITGELIKILESKIKIGFDVRIEIGSESSLVRRMKIECNDISRL